MSSHVNEKQRVYQDGSQYHLPKDAPEQERLEKQVFTGGSNDAGNIKWVKMVSDTNAFLVAINSRANEPSTISCAFVEYQKDPRCVCSSLLLDMLGLIFGRPSKLGPFANSYFPK